MSRIRTYAGEKEFQLLANQLARANTHYHFAKTLHDNRQQLGWAKDFWEYTLTAHCSIAFLDLCRVYDYHKDGLNLINCLQSIDKNTLNQAKLEQLDFYVGACRRPRSNNSLVNSLRAWRHNIIAHYNFEVAHDRDGFDGNNPDEPEKIIHSLIEMGFTILEWCSGLQGKATIYQKFAPGKDGCEKVLNRLL
jgi:hypothetical protein